MCCDFSKFRFMRNPEEILFGVGTDLIVNFVNLIEYLENSFQLSVVLGILIFLCTDLMLEQLRFQITTT